MSARRHSRGRQSGRRPGYYWDGIQLPATAVPAGAAQNIIVLIDQTAQEFMPATLVRIRGNMWVHNSGTASDGGATVLNAKLMYLEVNDALTVTGDHQAIDTNEEDIAARQLWQHTYRAGATVAGQEDEALVIDTEIDVKAKLRLRASGKWLLVLLSETSSPANFWTQGASLRCLMRHG